MNSSQVMLKHPASRAGCLHSSLIRCIAQEALCGVGISYCSQWLWISFNQAVQFVRGGLYVRTSHDLTIARIARGVRRYLSGAVVLSGGGSPLLLPPGFSLSAKDLAVCCKISLQLEVTGCAVVATRTPAPVVAAPVRTVPMDGMTVVVPADWNDPRRTRVALPYTKDW